MKRFSVIILSLGVLSACATVIEGQQQQITLRTPGADNAECLFHSRDQRFQLKTGETRTINKSERNLVADCRASGNRLRTVVISPELEKMAIGNVATGVLPGVAYDHLSQAMYVYPDVITVDFTNIPVAAYPLPDYMNSSVRNLYHGEMERYGQDRYQLPGEQPVPAMIQKRTSGAGITGNPFAGDLSAPYHPVPITEK